MHFNKSTSEGNILEKLSREIIGHSNFLAVDTLKIDDHLRLRFTKRTRNILPIQTGDELAVFQNKKHNTIIFNLQREGNIVDVWILRRLAEVDNNNYQVSPLEIQSMLNTNAEIARLEEPYQIPDNYRLVDVPDGQNDTQKLLSATHSNYQIALPVNNSSNKVKSTKHVMIVDDESDILMSFSVMLREHGIDSETFTNSADALLRFTEVVPSYYGLVILDIKMPGLNGLQLYKLMKAQKKDTKFLFVSAVDYATEFMKMLPDIDGKSLLTKPVDKDTLVKRINDML